MSINLKPRRLRPRHFAVRPFIYYISRYSIYYDNAYTMTNNLNIIDNFFFFFFLAILSSVARSRWGKRYSTLSIGRPPYQGAIFLTRWIIILRSFHVTIKATRGTISSGKQLKSAIDSTSSFVVHRSHTGFAKFS